MRVQCNLQILLLSTHASSIPERAPRPPIFNSTGTRARHTRLSAPASLTHLKTRGATRLHSDSRAITLIALQSLH
ncbi:hypothetical protein MHYP_G00122610 [Metynnis hypsauchen]